ncbi:terminase [Bulleidia sp. HCP3S3_F2]|uniref:terminase n=1 Tax=unclassified Bulleidia TaxID=2704656 RepID=UPI003F88DE7E
MAEPKRLGRQTPTKSVVLPYENTYGKEAIDIYEKTGRQAQDWQKLLIYDMLSYNDEGLWVHTKFGYSVPRRNGKNEVITIREMYGLIEGEQVLHTAHRTPTSSSAFYRLLKLLEDAGYKDKHDYIAHKQYGLETIEFPSSDGKVSFRTRTSKGGLGEGFDLMIIDEAQEYQDDQETTLKYVVSSSKNPQTLFCGTPPTMVSSGTVFMKMRNKALSGETENTGWAEWSVDSMTDVHDVEAWYETNPSLGTIFTERIIKDEIGDDDLDFNIQRLGYWSKKNLKSFISEVQWNECKLTSLPELKGKLYVGIKFGIDGQNVAMSIACKTTNEKVFVESIDCQPRLNGNKWMLRFLKQADIASITIDGNGSATLEEELKDMKLKHIIIPKTSEVITANDVFKTSLDQGLVVHMGQPSLAQSVSNCQKRLIGSQGGYGYQSIKEGIDICLMESMVFAFWQAKTAKERRKQVIHY